MDKNLVTVNQLSKLLGMSESTINYYTNLGLLKIAERKGNRRLYNRLESVERFKKIKKLRRDGYSLVVIQKEINNYF